MTDPTQEYIDWLVQQSMLHSARQLATHYAGQGRLWQQPYANTNPRAAVDQASVWFTAYPPAIITRVGESVLATLGDPMLWECLSTIGIQGIHTGPTKRAGGIQGRELTPTIDGQFDRIGLDTDPAFGTQAEFISMCKTAAAQQAIAIDDIIPSHTGKGADYRLAEMAYQDYPGIYHMLNIREEDWSLLPKLPANSDAVNLSADVVDQLHARGYIVGQLPRTIFYEPGIKETDWSATGVIVGVDGVARRWVYLHYFKAGQPALNWLDPSFAAQRLIIGDALHSLDVLGASGLRLDANGFLGIERLENGAIWSEGHPLAVVGNQLIASMIRKAGGFSFQELNLTVDDIATMSHGGADLSYDFITRPAYQHALVTGNTEFLRLMLKTVHDYHIEPMSLIHALQNHDELTLELVHFWTAHKDDSYSLEGQSWTGTSLREHIRSVMYAGLTGKRAPYNLPFVTNGVACTTASIIAAALGISDIGDLSLDQKRQIQRLHLLLVIYNAFQPGVFALSGWDLVGALTLPADSVAALLADGDTRWINRGAYDLVNVNPEATSSQAGLPKASMLYGPLTEQLQQPDSFARQLQKLLRIRQDYHIYASRQLPIPDVQNKALLVMAHELPHGRGLQITALNFGSEAIDEVVQLKSLPTTEQADVIDMLSGERLGQIGSDSKLRVMLQGYEGKSLHCVRK